MTTAAGVSDLDTTSTFTLLEAGGIRLDLTRRALPYLPLSISGKQRAEFTWYPGSPQATVQMLGPSEDAITISGYWKDRFLAGSGDAKVSGQSVATVADLVATVDNMRRQGRQVTMSWAGLIRIGHVTSFTQTWHNTHDVEWELEFSVLSHEATKVAAGNTPTVNLSGIANDATTQEFNTRNAIFGTERAATAQGTEVLAGRNAEFGISGPAGLNLLQQANAVLTEFDTQCTVFASNMANYAQSATALITSPSNTVRDIIATCSNTITQISNAAGTFVDTAMTEWYAITSPDGVDGVPFGLQVSGRSYQQQVKNATRSVVSFCAVTRYSLAEQLQGQPQRTFVAPADLDLRDVSRQFYGTPDEWRFLMTYNSLQTSRLQAGQVVIVPQQASTEEL